MAAGASRRVPMRRYGTTLAAIALAAIAIFLLGPAYLRHALSALLIVSRDVEAAAPYSIEVTPGNATVARGADQSDHREAVRLRFRAGVAHDAQVARRRLRARAASAQRERPVRRHAVRSGRADRILRRGERRQFEALQPEGRRSALRAAARARISLPGIHRPRAAEGRRRRRHRRAEGHRGPCPRACRR